ncbi:Exosome RNA helicase MTR4 [Chamberlinius hualienensis]
MDSADFIDNLFSIFDKKEITSKEPKNKTRCSTDPEKINASFKEMLTRISVKHGIDDFSDDSDEPDLLKKKLKTDHMLDIKTDLSVPRFKIHVVETDASINCIHEVAVPHDAEYVPLKRLTTAPAKEYEFKLDPFQKEALLCLDNSQSVLVSAHTSAGKTVVAEYAIAMALRDKQRVIYTTPIKALSNQKYRELNEEFKDVGLMTGDVTINPSASCLIMTTEILRSMLYRGSEIMREVAWVIFDEIHYMRDKERGVVWEETIILLPDNVHYVFLSATIPNARQFAEWICHLHKQPCHVVYTDYRPVPLQHYLFPSGGDGLHLVVDEQGTFKEENFNLAMSVLQNTGDASKGELRSRKGVIQGESNCFKIVKMIVQRVLAPVIVFSFSKKDCEAYAMQISKLDLNTVEEKALVVEVFTNAMELLSDDDKKLSQVQNVLPLLKRGIGIHHSGLLPILKETIEILFAEGLVKALFATETFAMGLNMPARTVLFTSVRKFDGRDFRWVSSGEYIQMSGRAGRRGIDDQGIVMLMIDEKMSPEVGKNLIKGKADHLNSAFHLTYNMILNLLRVEEINPEYMLERSFCQFQHYANIPSLYEKLEKCEKEYSALTVPKLSEISMYHKTRFQLDPLLKDMRAFIMKPRYILPFLQPGRLVKLKIDQYEFDWSMVIENKRSKKSKNNRDRNPLAPDNSYLVDVLLPVAKDSIASKGSAFRPCRDGEKCEMVVTPVALNNITEISVVRVLFPKDLHLLDNRTRAMNNIEETKKRYIDKGGLQLLDPMEDIGIKDEAFKNLVKRVEFYKNLLNSMPIHNDPELDSIIKLYEQKLKLGEEFKKARHDLKKAKAILQMDELKCRKRVLRRLGYSNASDVIEIKGRVACEISSGDVLLVTELLFNGFFNSLTPQQTAALLSCFVFQEKCNEMPKLIEELSGPLRQLQEMARRIARVSNESRLNLEEDSYVESFRPHLMEVVHAWCNGITFAEVCKMTKVFEGSIIRCMRRLEELLRQMCQASKAIGNTDLENKFSEAIKLLKRDIVFAASLYI